MGLKNITDDDVFNAWAVDALNDAMINIAVELQIPRVITTVSSVTTQFTLPSNMQTWGLLAVSDTTNGNPLAVVDLARRIAVAPTTATGTPRFVAYDPSRSYAEISPPSATDINLEILYAAVPTQMSVDTDTPFDGLYSEFHHVVAMGAALLAHEGDWADPQRIDWVRKRYVSEMEAFRQRINANSLSRPRSEVEIDPQRA